MDHISDIINNTDVKFQSALCLFATSIIDHASLTLDFIAEKQVLEEYRVISISDNGEYKITSWNKLIYGLLSVYKQRGLFAFSDDLNDWQNAEKGLQIIRGDRWILKNQFYQFFIEYIGSYYPTKFNSIVLATKLDIVILLRALNVTISSLQISSNQLYDFIYSIKDSESNIYEVILTFCRNRYDDGCELMRLIIDSGDESLNTALVGCMSGLLINDYEKTKNTLFSMYNDKYPIDQIIKAFTHCISIYPDKSNELFEQVLTVPEYRCDATIQFYWRIHGLNNNLKKRCEEELLNIVANASEELLKFSIGELMHLKSVSYFTKEYVDQIISNNHFSIEHVKILDCSIAYTICDTQMLFGIIRSILGLGLKIDNSMLELSIQNISEKEPAKFLDGVVELITDNSGEIRKIGRDLWDSNNLVNSNFNPLLLSVELQLRFIISMLQDFINPDCRLRKVLPLFGSSHPSVPKLLLLLLIPYTDNYLGSVMTELELLQLTNIAEIDRLKEYFEDRCAFIDKRIACKELNALYTQCNILNEFNRSDQEYTNELLKKANKENISSLRRLMPTVILAKAGGFRNKDGTVQELAHISHSIPFPAMLASLNYLEESELYSKIFANWINIKDIWKIL